MQFSGLHKLVNAKRAVEQNKSIKSLSTSTSSQEETKCKAKIDNNPYATALNVINQRQHNIVPNDCTSTQMRSVLENKSDNIYANENASSVNSHEQKPAQSLTEVRSGSENNFCKKPRLETETPEQENNAVQQSVESSSPHIVEPTETDKRANAEANEHTTNNSNITSDAITSSSSMKIAMTKSEVDELRRVAILNLTKIIDKALLSLMTSYDSNGSNNKNNNACTKCSVDTSSNVIMELLSQFVSQHDMTSKRCISDNGHNNDLLHSNKLEKWIMTIEDKREFELLDCITQTIYFDSASSQNESSELDEETKEDNDQNKSSNSTHHTNQICELEKLISILWFLLACSWCHDLDPSYDLPECVSSVSVPVSVPVVSSISLQGWSYDLYLFSVKRFTSGNAVGSSSKTRLVAEAHKHWVDAQRSRRCVLEIILYLTSDLQNLRRAHFQDVTHKQVKSTTAAPVIIKERDVPLQIVPTQLREGLESLFINELWRNKNFVQARQVYVDLTMGNANWKLGLFSAGEVHMRRSIERVERNRVRSLLNNEKAMILMHSLRQLIHFAERELPRMPHCQHAFYSLKSKE